MLFETLKISIRFIQEKESIVLIWNFYSIILRTLTTLAGKEIMMENSWLEK